MTTVGRFWQSGNCVNQLEKRLCGMPVESPESESLNGSLNGEDDLIPVEDDDSCGSSGGGGHYCVWSCLILQDPRHHFPLFLGHRRNLVGVDMVHVVIFWDDINLDVKQWMCGCVNVKQ